MLAVGFIPRLGRSRKSVASATVHAVGTSRCGSGGGDHKAVPIHPSLTPRYLGVVPFRGINPTANITGPYGTRDPLREPFPHFPIPPFLPCSLRNGEVSSISGHPDAGVGLLEFLEQLGK